jgi:CheY-like chemotaxis protein
MNAKVVIVDDEPDVLESTSLLIEALGYKAVPVAKPAEILAVVEREQPALILQDLKMPGLNFAGLVAALRLNPETAEIPLVFFSASSDLSATAARYDAWGFLPKPFSKEQLAQLLHLVLGTTAEPGVSLEGHDAQRKVRNVFHDYWNLLAAFSNYILILDESPGLPPEAQRAVRGLDELILKMESKTDRLSTFILALVNSVEPVPAAGESSDYFNAR